MTSSFFLLKFRQVPESSEGLDLNMGLFPVLVEFMLGKSPVILGENFSYLISDTLHTLIPYLLPKTILLNQFTATYRALLSSFPFTDVLAPCLYSPTSPC